MADLQKIASTYSIDLQPVGSLQERDHGRLVDILQQEIGDDAARLLAEPVSNRDGSRTDWYARGATRVVPLSSLPEDEALETRSRLSELEERIEALAERLAGSARADDRHLATALAHCLTVPDESFIYVTAAGDAVLTGWGFTRAHRPGYRGGLAKIAPMKLPVADRGVGASYAPVTDAPAAAAAIVEPSRRRWSLALILLWLLLAFLIAAILFLLLRACAFGITIPGVNLAFCPAAQPVAAQPSAIPDLQREMAALEARLLQRRDDCATASPIVPQTGAEPGSSADLDRRLEERNAQGGAVQISLIWNGAADLDLSVTCPGATLYHGAKRNCGGTLDVDSNTSSTRSAHPVENIFWTDASAVPQGNLPIIVTLYGTNEETADPIPYRVRILRTPPGGTPSEQMIDGFASRSAIRQPKTIGQVNP